MTFTIALVVSLFCGLTWAQDDVKAAESGSSRVVRRGLAEGDLQTQVSDLREKLAELETTLNKERYSVAFTAAIGNEDVTIGPVAIDTTLIYRIVKTNIGNFYNQHTGIFTAPVPGLYFFTYFYHARGEQASHLSLMKNDQYVVLASDHKTDHDTADNGGNAAYLQLQRGDQVYVRMAANTHVWGGPVSSTFSGLLVRQD